jgi:hypothetical protein
MTAAGIAALVVGACVIADPPTELPREPTRRPTILRSSVVPSTTAVLASWPSLFIVPVEISNPLSTIEWATFIDYNPATGDGFKQAGDSTYESRTTNGNIRTLELPIAMPTSDSCHLVEVIVGLDLITTDGRNAHTPQAPGGDSVSWFYSPSGDLAGCPVLDAGLSRVPDAEAGAEAGSTR